MTWQVPRMWEGGDVWIIGGGPSITKQFDIPNEVVRAVISGSSPLSVYSPYMECIHKKHVIGVNVAYMLGNWVDIVFFGDTGFFLKHKIGLAAFPNLRVSCSPHSEKAGWVKYVPKDKQHPKGITPNPKMVSWNLNSGAAAINLAVHTGVKRIILLGFDMSLSPERTQHWHNVYGKGQQLKPDQMRKLPFDRHLRGFPHIAKEAQMRGVEIINANPESMITCFKKTTVKELI